MGLIRKLAAALCLLTAPGVTLAEANPQVLLKTDLGDIRLELYPERAPVTVANFLAYVENFHYAGTIFHRVVPNFVIQAGGYTFDLSAREPGDPIVNESDNGLTNARGTVAMARLPDPDSARAQFFINLRNNSNLDARKDKPGYTVFGKVISGMNVVDKIARQPTGQAGIHKHLPKEPIRILSARPITGQAEQP